MSDQILASKALEQIEQIIFELMVRFDAFNADMQARLNELYATMRAEYAAAEWGYQQGMAMVRFLEALDSMPEVRAVIGPLLDATKGPRRRSISSPGDTTLLDRLPPELRAISMAMANGQEHETGSAPPPTTRSADVGAEPETSEPSPARLERYPHLDCPDQTILDQKFSLFVQLLMEAPEPGIVPISIEDSAVPEQLPEVEVVLRAPGFDIEGSNTQLMQVARDEESEVRFVLIPRRLGEQQIRVDFYQHGRRLGTVRRNVLAVEQPVPAEVPQPDASVTIELKSVPTIPPPDLELCVELDRHDGRTLWFALHSTKETVGYNHARVGQVTLQASPLEKMQVVYQEMSRMARTARATPEEQTVAERRLSAVGNSLWDELIPDELKRQYWRFKSRVTSILITSDEPWVPWEVIKPYRYTDEGEREDDRFWCQQFAISRWLSGPCAADALPVGTARPVAPAQVNLPSVQEEIGFIEQLGKLRPGITALAPFNDRLQVLDWLEHGKFSVLHFACHGLFDATLPNDSAITLTGGPLRPSDIRAHFAKGPRPLIFINACHGGRMEFSFTGLGGWADRLVKHACVGAFVGAMWEVNDALALQFARRFYTALLQDNATIAEAFRLAREEIRQAAPYNSTWLAYVLYADPEARVQVGAGA